MKKIFAVCAAFAVAASMALCASAEAPTNDVLLIAAAPDPSAPITPDDGASVVDTAKPESNSDTGAEGFAVCAAMVISGAVMLVCSKRK